MTAMSVPETKTHYVQRPDCSGRRDEIWRSNLLASERPNIEVNGRVLYMQNHTTWYALCLSDNVWTCTCTYSRTHDPVTDPCCHVRALEKWFENGVIADPRRMILD